MIAARLVMAPRKMLAPKVLAKVAPFGHAAEDAEADGAAFGVEDFISAAGGVTILPYCWHAMHSIRLARFHLATNLPRSCWASR